MYLYTDHQALEPLIKRNRSNRQYSAQLTRWLDRLTHFDISIQHTAGSNLKFTDYLSRNPVGGATPEEIYDEEYVINILTEQAKLNIKYGPIFADQSECKKVKTEIKNDIAEEQIEKCGSQSHTNRTFEKKYGVNKNKRNERATSGQSEISALEPSYSKKESQNQNRITKVQNSNTEITEMDRENFYHWGATREIMENIRRRNNSPETRRLVEQRNGLSLPETLRRRYDHYTQRTVLVQRDPTKEAERKLPR